MASAIRADTLAFLADSGEDCSAGFRKDPEAAPVAGADGDPYRTMSK